MQIIGKTLKTIINKPFRLHARGEIFLLRKEGDIAAGLLADALDDTLHNRLSSEERGWVDKIEALRENLNSSSSEISVVDYGAGAPTLERTEEEMYRGTIKTLTIGNVCQATSRSYFWALLLFKLIKVFKPLNCLELGTSLGISAAYQASALKLNKKGNLITLEGAESVAFLAKQHFQLLGLNNVSVVVGRFQDTLDTVLNEHGPLDYVFIDGHHEEKATRDYFERILPFLSQKAVLVFDDISWSDGMKRAWKFIEKNEKIRVSVNLRQIGICILDDNIERKYSYNIPLI